MLRSAEPVFAATSRAENVRATRPRTATVAGAGLAIVALAIITFDNPSASRIHTWPLAALTAALWMIPIGIALNGAVFQRRWRIPPTLLLSGLALLAVAAFLSALFSPFAEASLPRIWPTLGGFALYLYLHHAWSARSETATPNLDGISRLLGLAGVCFTLVSLVQWAGGFWPLPWGHRNSAPFGHSTYTAGAIILVIPWIILQAWTNRGIIRIVWLAAMGAALVVLVSTSSRGGALALAITGAATVGAVLVAGVWTWRQKSAFALGVLALGAAGVFTNPRLSDLILKQQWSEAAQQSNDQRRAMFVGGARLGMERPVLGWGPGTIPLAYPRVRAAVDGGTENILQLHNTPIQIWATTGSLGVLGLLLIVCGAGVAFVRAPRTPATFAAGASLGGYAVFTLTDHQLDLPVMVAFVAAGLALLTASAHPASVETKPTVIARLALGILTALVVVLALRPSLSDLRARRVYDSALTALGENRADDYLQGLDRAASATPHDAFFQHRAAGWLLDQREKTPDRNQQQVLARDAASRLERSLTTNAHVEFAHFNLGWLYLDLNQPAAAARHFAAAARVVPDKGGVYFGLGLAYQALEQNADAVRCFALEIINDPRHGVAPAWELPAFATIKPAVREEVFRLYSRLRLRFKAAETSEAWTRWWWGENLPPEHRLPAFNEESARFAASLAAISRHQPLPSVNADWAELYAAWSNGRDREDSRQPAKFLAVAKGDSRFAAVLASRAQRYGEDFRAFIAGPTGDESVLMRTMRRQRIGYGMLASHPEGPPLHDLYVVQENRIIADFAVGLFPPKGWLPGRFLLELLPANPR